MISLPTGKTPEHFIKWVQRLLQTWDGPETRTLLEEVSLVHEPLPELAVDDVDLRCQVLGGKELAAPLFISAMTGDASSPFFFMTAISSLTLFLR